VRSIFTNKIIEEHEEIDIHITFKYDKQGNAEILNEGIHFAQTRQELVDYVLKHLTIDTINFQIKCPDPNCKLMISRNHVVEIDKEFTHYFGYKKK